MLSQVQNCSWEHGITCWERGTHYPLKCEKSGPLWVASRLISFKQAAEQSRKNSLIRLNNNVSLDQRGRILSMACEAVDETNLLRSVQIESSCGLILSANLHGCNENFALHSLCRLRIPLCRSLRQSMSWHRLPYGDQCPRARIDPDLAC
jgi:hypothetical protein